MATEKWITSPTGSKIDIADFQNYLLKGAIYDTDCGCAVSEMLECNPNERKSVQVFLERRSRKNAAYTNIPAKKGRGHDER